MPKNTKQSSKSVASHAGKILQDPNASAIQRSLAASVIAQRGTSSQTGSDMETKASNVMKSDKYNSDTKELAASLVSQSNRER